MVVRRALLAVAAAGLACFAAPGESRATRGREGRPTRPPRDRAPLPKASPTRLPLLFLENRGQVDPRVAYYAPGRDLSVYFTGGGLTWALTDGERRWAVKQDFVGARAGARPEAGDPRETAFHWFRGPRERWTTGVRSFGKVVYADLWPGIDMACTAEADRLKTLFLVRPGADPGRIRFAWRGATSVAPTASGSLRVETPAGAFEDEAPFAWQEGDGGRAVVEAAYALEVGTPGAPAPVCGFRLGAYDAARPLLLDPAVVSYAGYIGGSGDESPWTAIAVDGPGNAYVAGYTPSSEATFPVTVGPDLTYSGNTRDAFVAKVRTDGAGLVYCGYIGGGGTGATGTGVGIAVDASGNAYVAGYVAATETTFPATTGPDLSYNGGTDAFVAKVRADGTSLLYCGYLGGTGVDDQATGIAVDGSGSAYVTGRTSTSDGSFPVTAGPDLAFGGGGQDAFVAKVRADGTGLAYCGYIGGASADEGRGVAVDSSGSALVTGSTQSTEGTFPVTVGPDLTYNGGGTDAFVARVSADGTALAWCGYIGGTGADVGRGVAVDASGSAYVAGQTSSISGSFPVAVGPDLAQNGGTYDGFVAKVSADGASLAWCGYLGGAADDDVLAVAVDSSGNAYLAGQTDSSESSFPVAVGPDLVKSAGTDAFVAEVLADGTGLAFCGYVGGVDGDFARGIAVDSSGSAYLSGNTSSTQATFPVYTGPDVLANGGNDLFVVKVVSSLPPPPPQDPPPEPPSGLVATVVDASRIDLAWNDNSGLETDYEVQRGPEGGPYAAIVLLGAGSTAYADKGVEPLRAYAYRVRATNAAGASDFAYSGAAATPGTLSLEVPKGRLRDRLYGVRDTFRARGRFEFNGYAADQAFDPVADGLEVCFGAPGDPYVILVPGEPDEWRVRKGRYSWRTPKGGTPRLRLGVDTVRRRFSIDASTLAFPRTTPGAVRVALRCGDDAGSLQESWTPDRWNPRFLRKR